MTTVMYKVLKWAQEGEQIQEVQVTRKTEKSVWFISGLYGKERMERRSSSYYQYFENRDDAVAQINEKNRLRNIRSEAERISKVAPDLLEALIESRFYVEMAANNCYNPVASSLLVKIDDLITKVKGDL